MEAILADLMSIEVWMSLMTLTLLEIVLGIDNVIFLSIICGRLPQHQRKLGRQLGLGMALVGRIIFLFAMVWMIKSLTTPVFSVMEHEVSWRDIVLLLGGLFLMYKATTEIHSSLEGHEEGERKVKPSSFLVTIAQIGVIDVVFALDSMITAIGMTHILWVMIVANVIAIIIMLYFSEGVARFIERFPTVKMLALSFLILIGVVLVADSMHFEIPRAYVYFAIAFSLGTETLNLLMHAKQQKRKSGK